MREGNGIWRRATLAFSAGALGGLANSLALWIFGVLGITHAIGVAVAPKLTAPWLYPRIVWGGIWGFLFLLPILRRAWWVRGLVFGLGPSLAQLLIVFPVKTDQGLLGLGLGAATPLVVLLVNSVWGLVAAWWFAMVERR